MMRSLPCITLSGAWQMAIDEWLLDEAVRTPAEGSALRFYRWQRPTLSLGFHQKRVPAHWLTMAEAGVVDLVRRPSGGRAVLHAGDLTYALIWPDAPPQRQEAYRLACGWLVEAFRALDLPLVFGKQTPSFQRASCFATGTTADLVHHGGVKRVGSAQLWRRGHLLQHGSILIDPPETLWWDLFGEAPPALPSLPMAVETLIPFLQEMATRHLPKGGGQGAPIKSDPLGSGEWEEIGSRLSRYRPALQAADPTSPEETMARAT